MILLGCVLTILCRQTPAGRTPLRFIVRDGMSGEPIPAKLVFLLGNRDGILLNMPYKVGLAAEDNGFYTAFGEGEVIVPSGRYTVFASRGMEYSIDRKRMVCQPDSVVEAEWILNREIDPEGYIGSDFHMHTLNSDGNCDEEGRVTLLVGEGVEFAAAADHNYVTDFKSAVADLGVTQYLMACPGNELSTDIGRWLSLQKWATTWRYSEQRSRAKMSGF